MPPDLDPIFVKILSPSRYLAHSCQANLNRVDFALLPLNCTVSNLIFPGLPKFWGAFLGRGGQVVSMLAFYSDNSS